MKGNGQILIAGCGPGHPDYVTEAVRKAVSAAELLVGAQHLLNLFPESNAQRMTVGADIDTLLQRLDEIETKDVVVLASGDTGLYSLARTLLNHFGRKRCQLIPGISSVQIACARLALDWHDLKIVSAHGREPQCAAGELAGYKKLAILAGTESATRWAASMLESLGDNYVAFACENLTWEDERITELDVPGLLTAELASRTVIMLVSSEVLV